MKVDVDISEVVIYIKPDLTCPSRIEIGSGLKKIKEIKTRGDKVKNSVTIY